MRRLPVLAAIPIALVLAASLPPVQALYLPSPELVRRLVAESEAKPAVAPPVYEDVVYHRGIFGARRLDVYGPTREPAADTSALGDSTDPGAGGGAPVVVFFHGGSWLQGDKVTIRVVDRFLSRMRDAGYFVVAVNYTTSIARGLAGPVENARRAVRWVARHAGEYGWDADNIGLYGVSAGGHVALMAASTMELHDATLAFAFIECAPTDLVAMRDGDAFDQSSVFGLFAESRLRAQSPVTHVRADLPPVLVFHGGLDRTVHMNQSELYVDALRAAGGQAELVRYPEGDHAFLNLSDDIWYAQETRALDFFAREFAGALAP